MKRKTTTGRRLMLLAIAVLAATGLAFNQEPAPRHKVLTPEQRQFQAETVHWRKQYQALRVQAEAALDAETAHEKTGDCPKADTTLAAEQCLAAEIAKTQSNYAAFAASIRAMLALAYPTMPEQQPASGTPPSTTERVGEFDQLEAQSKRYREDAARAAYNQYKGGTLAPVFAAEAEQRLLRLHLQELAFIYGKELSNH